MENIELGEVKSLLDALEQQDFDQASEIFDGLVRKREENLLEKVEEITQNLHETLEGFGSDRLILKHAKHDLPEASERLQYVIDSTEEASAKTLSASENIMALLETVESQIENSEAKQQLEQAKAEVTEIMMAQSFQDLTGQVLNRVILLVTTLEQSLVELIEKSGINLDTLNVQDSEEDVKSEEMKGVGPNVTKSSKKDSVQSQNDVDDLLGELGI